MLHSRSLGTDTNTLLRSLTLKNGLKVLLISDMETVTSDNPVFNTMEKEKTSTQKVLGGGVLRGGYSSRWHVKLKPDVNLEGLSIP